MKNVKKFKQAMNIYTSVKSINMSTRMIHTKFRMVVTATEWEMGKGWASGPNHIQRVSHSYGKMLPSAKPGFWEHELPSLWFVYTVFEIFHNEIFLSLQGKEVYS